jgi:GDP-L-fucose synthase
LSDLKIALLGSSGFIGSNISSKLAGNFDYVCHTRNDFDINNQKQLSEFLTVNKITHVINCIGEVAGVQGNLDRPASLLISNLTTATSIIKVCHDLRINQLIQFASACVYPINEIRSLEPDDLGSGPIEPSSKSYATAKLAMIEATKAFNKEFGYRWTTFIPSNLYGPGDWNRGDSAHVISSLMNRFLIAKKQNRNLVVIWGDGKSKRNFLHVSDLAEAVLLRLRNESRVDDIINLSGDCEISIYDLAHKIADICNFEGKIQFDLSKPNGARRKLLDDAYWRRFGWDTKINLDSGLREYQLLLEAKL